MAQLKHRAESPDKETLFNTKLIHGVFISIEDEIRPSNALNLTPLELNRTMDQIGLSVRAIMKNTIQFNEYEYRLTNPRKKI